MSNDNVTACNDITEACKSIKGDIDKLLANYSTEVEKEEVIMTLIEELGMDD